VLIVGRATKEYEGEQLPGRLDRARGRPRLPLGGDPELEYGTDVIIDVKLGEGSGDLQDVFGEGDPAGADGQRHLLRRRPRALTETETIVYEAEHELNTTYHADHPELGPDVKIMGKREGDRIDITVAAAMVDRYVDGLDEYDDAVENVREFVTELAESRTDREVHVDVNTADDYDEGSVYLTVTGTSRGAGRRRVRGTRQPRERAHHSEPAHVHGGDLREEPRPTTSGRSTTSCRPGSRSPSPRRSTGSATCRSACSRRSGARSTSPTSPTRSSSPRDGVALGDIEPKVLEIVDRELANVTDVTRSVIDGDVSTF